jgi:hypothetical protein
MGTRSLLAVAFVCLTCCARTGLRGGEDTPVANVACHPGDAPLVLASNMTSVTRTGLATDGAWLYVAQQQAPTLWSVPAGGGDVTALDASDVAGPVAWNGGVYIVTQESAKGGRWIRHDGLASHDVPAGRFTPPTELDDEVVDSLGAWTLWVRTIETGENVTSYQLPPWFAQVGLSGKYLHTITQLDGKWIDARFDRLSAQEHDTIPLDFSDTRSVIQASPARDGPTAFCVRTTCVLDDRTQPVEVDLDSVLALDDDFAYGPSAGELVRVGLRDARREVLADVAPQAVAVANGCVYAASADQVLRLAPSE